MRPWKLESATGYHSYDLAHLWREATGQAFRLRVLGRAARFARAENPKDLNLAKIFQQSRDHGLQPEHIDIIAREWSPKLGLSESDIRSYLTENIHYYLDRENHAGLKLFLQYSAEIWGLFPQLLSSASSARLPSAAYAK